MFVALLLAAIHFAFMRWMTRQPEPATVRDPETPQPADSER
jgi:hypothetical protein